MSVKILPRKNTAAEICNLSKINKSELKVIKETINEFGMVYLEIKN